MTVSEGVDALQSWTGTSTAAIIYDSTVDEFTATGLFEKIKGKPDIAIVGFTRDGDVFGRFYRFAGTEQQERSFDPNIFAFSFESHGRCATPQRFAVRGHEYEAFVHFFMKDMGDGFVGFLVHRCCDGFFLGNERSDSVCSCLSDAFAGLEDTTLTGVDWYGGYHHCTRVLAVRLSLSSVLTGFRC